MDTSFSQRKKDWINQRAGVFDSLIPLIPTKKMDANSQSVFLTCSNGLKTNRDAWIYHYSKAELEHYVKGAINFYNAEVERYNEALTRGENPIVTDFINTDSTKFAWDAAQKETDLPKRRTYVYEPQSVYVAMYRPFVKQYCYFNKNLNNRRYCQPSFFPTAQTENLVICVSGAGVNKPFSCIISNVLPDLEIVGKSQCFPLHVYEEVKVQESSFFAENHEKQHRKHHGITSWMLNQVRTRYYGANNMSQEDVFYYIYGMLHSSEYRETFANELRKDLPRIIIPETIEQFYAFMHAGRKLAELHLNYEKYASPPQVIEEFYGTIPTSEEEQYAYYAVNKMEFASKTDKSTLVFNHNISLKNIPLEAYNYIINGKSAIEGLMDSYKIKVHKDSQIKKDPNTWTREMKDPQYIYRTLKSVIHVSVETQKIVSTLPKVNFKPEQTTE